MFLLSKFSLLFLAMFSVGSMANLEVIELPLETPIERPVQKQWHLGVGNYFDLPGETQVSPSGEKQTVTFWPLFSWGRNYQGIFNSEYFYAWDVLLSLPQAVGTSDLTRTLLCL